MAAPDQTLSRLGRINDAGDVQALFLKVFSGEVLTEFQRSTAFMDRHHVRSISSGKSAQFPMIGTASASYHTPGVWIDGSAIKHAEKIITIDALLQSNVSINDLDEAMNHYDVRGPYAQELGQALSQAFDFNVARCFVLGARSSNALTGRPGGTRIGHAAMDTDQDALRTALFTAAQRLDEKNVPSSERYAWFKPAQYYLMAQDRTLIDSTLGGSGSISQGTMPSAAGFPITKTNNVPQADDSANAALQAKYQADYSDTIGIVAHRSGAGTVKLLDMSMETDREVRNQGTFVIAKYAVGHDYLRSESSVELYKS